MKTKKIGIIGGQVDQRRELADILAEKYSFSTVNKTQGRHGKNISDSFKEQENFLFFEGTNDEINADLYLLIDSGLNSSKNDDQAICLFQKTLEHLQKKGAAYELIGGTADCLFNNALLACDVAFCPYTDFFFFVEPSDPFSQWHPSGFMAGGFCYNCAEQYMMHQKALLFGDMDTADRIMQTDNPAEHQALGRSVRAFESRRWKQHSKKIVYDGNYAKFTQNPALLALLKSTSGKLLVEAYEHCNYWSVGIGKNDPRILDRSKWTGKNWIGFILTRLREEL